jgi:hypothetical protein
LPPDELKFYLKIVADTLSKPGQAWGCATYIDMNGRTIRVTDAHRDDGACYVVHWDERLTAFLELESAVEASRAL